MYVRTYAYVLGFPFQFSTGAGNINACASFPLTAEYRRGTVPVRTVP